MPTKGLTPRRDAMLRLYAKGIPDSLVAKALGCTTAAVRQARMRARDAGLDVPVMPRAPRGSPRVHDHEEIRRLASQGMSTRAVAAAAGCSHTTVRRALGTARP